MQPNFSPSALMPNKTRRRFLVEACLAAGALALRDVSDAETAKPVVAGTAKPVVATTASGRLRGQIETGVKIFRGVPFAAPPIGALRFRPTEKVKPWTGIRDATRFSSAPLQPAASQATPSNGPPGNAVSYSEDCLYLNVWAPQDSGPFPVFVWIHGGGFTAGHAFDAMYDGTAFAREGIVCITVAYRLGVFGFLDVESILGDDYAGTANNGLHDLLMALKWIQANVAAFGGDRDRVTIGGESAGAKLTGILMGVPAAQPLFHQMISESGGAERLWPAANSRAIAKGFADVLARLDQTTPVSPAGLLDADGALLIDAQQQLLKNWPQHFPLRAQTGDTLLPRLPVDTIAQGSTRGKRLLIGTNREESAFFLGPKPGLHAAAGDLGNMGMAQFDQVLRQYAAVYPALDAEQRLIRAVTAEEYWVPSMRVVEAHLRGGGGPAYVYELTFAEAGGRLKGFAYHSEDVGLVWGHPHRQAEDAVAETSLGRQMHAAWAAFIRGEVPAAPGLPLWPAYETAGGATMMLDEQSRVEMHPQANELRLWNGPF